MEKDVLYTTMIMTFTVGVDLGFVLGCFLLIFYHIASMTKIKRKMGLLEQGPTHFGLVCGIARLRFFLREDSLLSPSIKYLVLSFWSDQTQVPC